MTTPTKTCRTCGRRIELRRKWRGTFEEVRHCSNRCRRNRPNRTDRALESAIEELLDQRGTGRSICPSEAARLVAPDDWRSIMERARMAARRLVAAERLQMTQGGRVVDPSTARGPVRLRRPLQGWRAK